jgi:hypothetical protein
MPKVYCSYKENPPRTTTSMNPIGIAQYIVFAGVFVTSFFLGLRMVFANDYRRETWRSTVKRYIYFSRPTFKRVSIASGFLLFSLSLFVAYHMILDLAE